MKKIIRFKFLLLVSAIFLIVLSGCSATAVPLSQATKEKIARLEWSQISKYSRVSNAGNFCWQLNREKYGGHEDWRLPTIDELRSIIQNCPGTELEGECRISKENDNLSYHQDYSRKYCHACKGENWQNHSALPDLGREIISSSRVDEQNMIGFPDGSYYYGVDFTQYGSIVLYSYWDDSVNVVCVREN